MRLEGPSVGALDPADPAIRLHDRQERRRRGDDHRRHGPALRRALRRFLRRFERQRLCPFGGARPRAGRNGLRLRRAQDASPFRRRLRQVRLCRRAECAGGRSSATPAAQAEAKAKATENARDATPLAMPRNAIADVSDESGWAALGRVGSPIAKQSPEFDARNYGFARSTQGREVRQPQVQPAMTRMAAQSPPAPRCRIRRGSRTAQSSRHGRGQSRAGLTPRRSRRWRRALRAGMKSSSAFRRGELTP